MTPTADPPRGTVGGHGQDRPPRPRRGRRPGPAHARQDILHAARREFAQRGYDMASLRGIARTAGVDAALVHHYFDGKADLFVQAVAEFLDPESVVERITDGPLESAGERLVRVFLQVWDNPVGREQLAMIVRSAATNDTVASLVRSLMVERLYAAVTAHYRLPADMARFSLVASQVVGYAMAAYVMDFPGLNELSADQVVAALAPTIQRYLAGPLA